ncbi:MAG: Riboflavin biosynthesis protein RibD [Verrucomicrobiales bacterium]|nr:Riboflavin biosynthesis protein RibD [Verrucomicrobiales bacterium]
MAVNNKSSQIEERLEKAWMRRALALARKAYGQTSPNPMVGALVVRSGKIVGEGYHHMAGQPHAEIEALKDAISRNERTQGATLVVTLEPCSTHGRTPPCTEAIIQAGIKRVIAGACDPNPRHEGRGFEVLTKAGVEVTRGVESQACAELNRCFNHWIVTHTPYVTLKCAITLDGRIATATGESKWITGPAARRETMRLRRGAEAVLVGVNTVIQDDPRLTVRDLGKGRGCQPWRIVLDPTARIPLSAGLLNDEFRERTIVVVGTTAKKTRIVELQKRVEVLCIGSEGRELALRDLMRHLGQREIMHLLIEGGGETHSHFVKTRLVNEACFFYAPKILGGLGARRGVGGLGAEGKNDFMFLNNVSTKLLGGDLLVRGLCQPGV